MYVGALCNVSHMNILVKFVLLTNALWNGLFLFNGGVNEMLTPTFMSEWSEIRGSSWKDNTICYLGVTWGKYSIFLKINKIEREC